MANESLKPGDRLQAWCQVCAKETEQVVYIRDLDAEGHGFTLCLGDPIIGVECLAENLV